ncbi:choice-of-anchor G family protein [Leucobacter sp. gxy201]|uniref:choice-of-anchor G family protein n=1 Tax=Leucobacter sp. gxy201 TaxID=2957200 RepID=UPI003DA1683C
MSLRDLLRRLTSRPAHARPFVPTDRLWKRGVGAAAAAVLVSTALVAQGGVTTSASWNDAEWVHAPTVGTLDCTQPDGAFTTRGEGRALSGSLLGIDLDQVAEASGVLVTNDGTRDRHTPDPGANPAPLAPAWGNPLNVGLLGQAINLDLGDGMLQLPLDNQTGVLGQYAQATAGGVAQGAAGFIDSSGGIATAPGSGYPELATVNLKQLISQVDPTVAATLANVTDLSLEVGAVTGRAALDGCDAAWNGVSSLRTELVNGVETQVGNLSREYLATSADLVIETPAVGSLTQKLDGVVQNLETTVNGLASNQSVLDGLLTSVTGLLSTLVSGVLSTNSVALTLTATVDTAALRNAIHRAEPLTDSHGVVSVDLSQGTIRVNTVALLQEAYPGAYGNGLNGLPPNSNLLADEQVLTTLTNTVTDVLGDWLHDIEGLLASAIDAIQLNVLVTAKLRVTVLGVGVANIGTVQAVVSGPLNGLTTQVSTTVDLTLLNVLDPLGLLGLKATVNGLLNALTSGLIGNLGPTVKNALETVLGPLRALPTDVREAVVLVVTTASGLYTNLLLPAGPSLKPVISVVLNAQNDPFSGGDEPEDWETTSVAGLPDGRYDVAALRIGVLEGLANGAILYLGRGSVGPGCAVATATQPGSPCAGY